MRKHTERIPVEYLRKKRKPSAPKKQEPDVFCHPEIKKSPEEVYRKQEKPNGVS